MTPWGFLRGAAANGVTVRTRKISDVPYKLVTWVPPQKAPSGQAYKVVGYINPENLVDRVETWVEHPVFGDMHVESPTATSGTSTASGSRSGSRRSRWGWKRSSLPSRKRA